MRNHVDAINWTQLGGEIALAATGIFDNAEPLILGAVGGTTNNLAGKIKRAQVYDNIGAESSGPELNDDPFAEQSRRLD